MKFLRKIFRQKKRGKIKGASFNSTSYEMNNLICGIGNAIIEENLIQIENYPFEPSIAYPNKRLTKNNIEAICTTSYPPLIKVENEVIFISREKHIELEEFIKRNGIKTFKETRNWNWILEPYVDTEYTDETDKRLRKLLLDNGIDEIELKKIRDEVGIQMYKYNFDTMLWDWGGLGLSDVLCAMRVKYVKDEFRDFFNRAMEIELRRKNTNA